MMRRRPIGRAELGAGSGPPRGVGRDLARRHGRVSDLIGLIIEATGLEAEVGEVCSIGDRPRPATPVAAEVVGFRERRARC